LAAGLFFHKTSWSSVNILLSHILAPTAIVISSMLIAMLQSAREFLNYLRPVKYAVMLVVGSHGIL
jgi:hypothetical protein